MGVIGSLDQKMGFRGLSRKKIGAGCEVYLGKRNRIKWRPSVS